MSPPEASCSSSLRTAKAVVEEAHDSVSPALRKLAKSSEGHAETSFKKTIDEQGLALEVPLTEMSFGKHSFPVLLLSDWIDLVVMLPKIDRNFTLNFSLIFGGLTLFALFVSRSFETVAHPRKTGNWHTLAAAEDSSQACEQLQLFWDRFKVLRPGHQIFDLERSQGVDLSRTCPFMLHGDEGRSKKRLGVMITSAHSVLGKGVSTKKKRKFDEATGPGNDQQMNYMGATHVTRFLMSVLPKFYYGKNEACFHALIEFLSKDLQKLALDGVLGHDGFRYRIAFVSVKGDWPYLHKIAGLTRSFYNQPKRQDAKNPCGGICHWCLAVFNQNGRRQLVWRHRGGYHLAFCSTFAMTLLFRKHFFIRIPGTRGILERGAIGHAIWSSFFLISHRVKTWRFVYNFCLQSTKRFAEGQGPNAIAQSFQRIFLASRQAIFQLVGGRRGILLHLLLNGWLPISIPEETTLSKAAFWRKQRPDLN